MIPETRGSFDGSWFVEEDPRAARHAIHVEARVHCETSPFQKIDIYDTSFFGHLLTLDDVVMLTERDEFVYHEMIVHVPLCTIPEPRSVLVIGGGDCGTLREALAHPGIERVVQCEIDERVTEACKPFFPWVEPAIADPRAELVFGDGAAYVEKHEREFDLVVIDGTDPKGMATALFMRDFYAHVARALRPGGVMSAQAESPFWAAPMVSAIYDELRAAFAHATGYLAWIPTYASGCWNLAYASPDRRHDEFFDRERATAVGAQCRYYNADVHGAAFALPNFARRAIAGDGNPFAALDDRYFDIMKRG